MKNISAFFYISGLLLIFSLTTILVGGCSPAQTPSVGFHPALSFSEPPVLGKPVILTLKFVSPSLKGLEGRETFYSARINLPPERYELIDGNPLIEGKIIAGESHILQLTIKSTSIGYSSIYAYVSLHVRDWGTGNVLSDSDVLWVTITKESASISKSMPVVGTISPLQIVALIAGISILIIGVFVVYKLLRLSTKRPPPPRPML